MEIDRKDTNIQIGKRLREARTNMIRIRQNLPPHLM
jgi:hypothetical protein